VRRLVLAVVGAVILLIGAGGLYVARHPLIVLPTLVRATGGTMANSVLRHHPLPLGDRTSDLSTSTVAVRIESGLSPSASVLARAVAGALAHDVPAHFRLTSADLDALPSAVRSYAASLINTTGSLQQVLVVSASGTLKRGEVDTVAVLQVDKSVYRVSATLEVQNNAIMGLQNLTITQP
jgi:hypothetical protein